MDDATQKQIEIALRAFYDEFRENAGGVVAPYTFKAWTGSGEVFTRTYGLPPGRPHDPRQARASTLAWLRGRKRRGRR